MRHSRCTRHRRRCGPGATGCVARQRRFRHDTELLRTNNAQPGTSALLDHVDRRSRLPIRSSSVATTTLTGATFEHGRAGRNADRRLRPRSADGGRQQHPGHRQPQDPRANTTEGLADFSTLPGPDGKLLDNPLTPGNEAADNIIGPNGPGLSVIGVTTIDDPDNAPATGDETATPLSVSASLFRRARGRAPVVRLPCASATARRRRSSPVVLIAVTFSCTPGTPTPAGCGPAVPPPGVPRPAQAPSRLRHSRSAPPRSTRRPPHRSASMESASVGVTQSIPIDLIDNCTDVNSNIDTSTFMLETPGAGRGRSLRSDAWYLHVHGSGERSRCTGRTRLHRRGQRRPRQQHRRVDDHDPGQQLRRHCGGVLVDGDRRTAGHRHDDDAGARWPATSS